MGARTTVKDAMRDDNYRLPVHGYARSHSLWAVGGGLAGLVIPDPGTVVGGGAMAALGGVLGLIVGGTVTTAALIFDAVPDGLFDWFEFTA